MTKVYRKLCRVLIYSSQLFTLILPIVLTIQDAKSLGPVQLLSNSVIDPDPCCLPGRPGPQIVWVFKKLKSLFLHSTLSSAHSLKSSFQDYSNEWLLNRVWWRNKRNVKLENVSIGHRCPLWRFVKNAVFSLNQGL